MRPVLHWAWYDDLRQRRQRRTACGIWVALDAIAKTPVAVTCPDCDAALTRQDAQQVGDDDESANPF